MFKFVYWSLYGRKTYCEIHWFPISIVVVPHFHGRGSPVFHPTFLIIVLLIIREFRGYCIYPIILIPFVIGLPPLFPPCIHDLSSISLFLYFSVLFFECMVLEFVYGSSYYSLLLLLYFLFLFLRLMIFITYLFVFQFLLSSIYIFCYCHLCLLCFPLDFPFSLS